MKLDRSLPAFVALERLPARLAVNAGWLLFARLASQALGMVFTVLIARRLGEAGLGQFSFISAVVFTGNVVTTFGVDTWLIRALAGHQAPEAALSGEPRQMAAAIWLQLILCGFGLALLWPAARWLQPQLDGEATLALQLAGLAWLPLAFFTVYSAGLRAAQRMDLYAWANLGMAGLQLAAAPLALASSHPLLALSVLLVITQGAGALLAFWLWAGARTRRGVHWSFVPIPVILDLGRASLPLAGLSILAVLYQRQALLLLPFLAGSAAAGQFSAAARLVEALKLLHFAWLGALLPALSAANQRSASPESNPARRMAERLNSISLLFLLSFGILAGALLTWLAGWLISWLYGSNFAAAVTPLRLLAWSLVPYAISAQGSLRLVTLHRERMVMSIQAAALLAAALLTVSFSRWWGAAGAALAILLAESLQALLFLVWGARSNLAVLGFPTEPLQGTQGGEL